MNTWKGWNDTGKNDFPEHGQLCAVVVFEGVFGYYSNKLKRIDLCLWDEDIKCWTVENLPVCKYFPGPINYNLWMPVGSAQP